MGRLGDPIVSPSARTVSASPATGPVTRAAGAGSGPGTRGCTLGWHHTLAWGFARLNLRNGG